MKLKKLLLTLFIATIVYPQNRTTFQAEEATLYKASIEYEHAGFTGSGYVNFLNEIDGYIEWLIPFTESSVDTLIFIFANGGTLDRTMELNINYSVVSIPLSFHPTGAWTNWDTVSVAVNMVNGNNYIRLTSITNEGGPNIDKIEVTGQIGIRQYHVIINVLGLGNIIIVPNNSLFDEGTEVTFTAIPDVQNYFSYWLGVDSISQNPLVLTIDKDYNITAVFENYEDSSAIVFDKPIGFASLDTLYQNGTYGGEGGDTVFVTTGEQLFTILDGRRDSRFEKNYPPLILVIKNKLTWTVKEMMDVKETYNLSIIGQGKYAQIEGFGLNLFRSHNIIIRNILFNDAPDDCIDVTNELSHHIWIDHCTFTDSPAIDISGNNHDGLLDIKDGASFVTVSWNHFANHHKSCLLGHSDNNGATDIGRLKVTYYNNWFDNTLSRHPRVRFGEAHVINNFYDNSKGGMKYGIASTLDAKVLVEGNYFLNVPSPTHSGYDNSGPGELVETYNMYIDSGEPETLGKAFEPSKYYSYSVTNPILIPKIVMKNAGHGKLDSILTSNKNEKNIGITGYSLEQNYPNPFNPETKIRFTIPNSSVVNLSVYNSLGQVVKELVNGNYEHGLHEVIFDAKNLSSGIYFVRMKAENFSQIKKIVLLK